MITNAVQSIEKLGAGALPCIKVYDSAEQFFDMLPTWLADEIFLSSGSEGRRWIEARHTYVHRAKSILEWIKKV